MRPIRIRVGNAATNAIRQLRVNLEYLDAGGRRLGQWTTVHAPETLVTPAATTNEVTLRGFFVPTFTYSARVQLAYATLEGGTRWPE